MRERHRDRRAKNSDVSIHSSHGMGSCGGGYLIEPTCLKASTQMRSEYRRRCELRSPLALHAMRSHPSLA